MFSKARVFARRLTRLTATGAVLAVGGVAPLSPTTAGAVGATLPETLSPYAWGSMLTGSSAHLAWGSPVIGDGTLTSTRPSGGGTLGAAVTADGPESKLSSLIAFGGGEVLDVAEGGAANSNAAHMIAIVRATDGSIELWAWGHNSYGQLGNGTRTASQLPVQVSWEPRLGEQILALSVGEGHSLMLTQTAGVSTVYAWGRNNVGQLGIADVAMSSTGLQTTPRVVPTLEGEDIVDIAAGRFHSVAIDADGSAWVWGYDAATTTTAYGDLGVSGTKPRPVPVHLTDDTLLNRRATPTSYSVTNNVATVTTSDRNFFDVRDTVTTSGTGVAVLDTSAAITKVTATGYSHIAQPNVASTSVTGAISLDLTTATPTAALINANVAQLTIDSGHDLRVGNRILVDIGDPVFDGERTVTARGNTYVRFWIDVASTTAPDGATATFTATDPVAVTSRALTSNVATLTVPSGHPFKSGNRITVSVGDATFDGAHTITSVTSTTIRYAVSAANVTATATTGTATLDDPTVDIVDYSVTGTTATVTADPTGPSHNFAVGNSITVSGLNGIDDYLSGTKTITAVSATTFSFAASTTRSSVAASGTIDVVNPTDVVTSYAITNNVASLSITSGHTFEVGNTITVSGVGGLDNNLDGTKTITAVGGSTISFTAQPNVAATSLGGSPESVVSDCSSSCPTAPGGMVEVAAGSGFTVARTSTGEVITWGYTHTNNYGRLGRTGDHRPAAITLPSGCVATQLDVGPATAAAACADGRIMTWGYNGYYNLGTNVTTGYVATPNAVSGLSLNSGETILDVDLDAGGGTVLTSDGRVLTWGRGAYGRLGKTSVTTNQKTVQIANRVDPTTGGTPIAVFSNWFTSGVVDDDGIMWTWGFGGGSGLQAQGVTGPTTTVFSRVGVDPDARIALIDTTYLGTVVALTDGSMWSWGTKATSSGTYFLGDGTSGSRLSPGRITLPVGPDTSLPSASVTGLDCSYTHCLITTSNGSIYGWGDGKNKSLVLNSTTDRTSPTLIKSGLTDPAIAAGNGYSLYVDRGADGLGGTAYAWGINSYHRASPTPSGTSTLTAFNEIKNMSDTASPVAVNDIIALSAGNTHSVALRADGTLMTWGRNNVGQLGEGSTTSAVYYYEPSLPGGRTAVTLHAEGDHILIRATDGTVHGWGRNTSGVLGTGNTTNILEPTIVASGLTFRRIDTSGYPTNSKVQTTVGLTTDGAVMTWGSNAYGQLGRTDRPANANGFSATPLAVETTDGNPLTDVDDVVTGGGWSGAFHRAAETLPSAPSNLTATSSASSTIDLTWTAPVTPAGMVGYVITVSRAGTAVFTTGAGASATALTLAAPELDIVNGQEHSITIAAVNAAGTSPASGPATATPTGLPTEVLNLDASPQLDGIRITFSAPLVDGGLDLAPYTVAAVPVAGGTTITQTVAPTSSSLELSLTLTDGLVADTEYRIDVTANNANGAGPTTSSTVVIPGRPDAPEIDSVIGLVTGARITVTPPADDGGAAVLSHVVTLYDTGTSTVVATAVIVMPATSIDVTGLTDGNVYDVVARASQAADGNSLRGPASASLPVTAGRPIAPTGLTLTPSTSRTLTVEWSPVADVAGIEVTGYETRTTVGASVGAAVARTCSGDPCSVSIGSLTNGTSTSIEVRAVSAGGAGPWSPAVAATPRTVPDPPAAMELLPSDQTASIAFDAPLSNGGDALDAYLVTITPTAGGDAVWTGTLGALETSTAIDELENGTSYTVSVRARNRAGNSNALTGTVTPATVPGAPTRVRLRPGSIIATWDAPSDDGGDAVDYYEVTVTDPDGISTTVATSGTASCSTTLRTCSITQVYTSDSPETLVSIPSDVEYRVSVTAVNGQGSGASTSDALIVSAQPSEPVSPAATPGVVSIAVCWSAPATVPSGRTVTAYRIRLDDGTDQFDATVPVADLAPDDACTSPSIGHVVTSFDDGSAPVAGRSYTVTVAASTSTDDLVFGIESTDITAMPYDLPGEPTITALTRNGADVTVSWSAADDNGEAIDAYTVTANPGGETCTWTTGPLECEFADLTEDVDYTFTVVATNDAGDGPSARSSAVRIDLTAPSATWSSATWVDDATAVLTISFSEDVNGFAASDLGGVGDCTVTLGTVTSRSAEVTLACSAGSVTPVLNANAVLDSSDNPGPATSASAETLTFVASAPTPQPSPEPTPEPTPEPSPTTPPSTPGQGSTDDANPANSTDDANNESTSTTSPSIGFSGSGAEAVSGEPGPTSTRLPATGTDAGTTIRHACWLLSVGVLAVIAARRRNVQA